MFMTSYIMQKCTAGSRWVSTRVPSKMFYIGTIGILYMKKPGQIQDLRKERFMIFKLFKISRSISKIFLQDWIRA
jgi:hypothetical protein